MTKMDKESRTPHHTEQTQAEANAKQLEVVLAEHWATVHESTKQMASSIKDLAFPRLIVNRPRLWRSSKP